MKSKKLAWKIRRNALEMVHNSKASHIGSIFSASDIIAVLYTSGMHVFPDNPNHDERDRFILSKGHAGAGIYAALAEIGFFSKKMLDSYCSNGSKLSGHISHKEVPGVELSTGSLGHGLGVGAGMALAAKMENKTHRVFVLMGDGECNEGSIWEAALFANHYRLNNLVAIIDHNKLQSLDLCENTLELIDIAEKFRAFGWNVQIIDGHDHDQILHAIESKSDYKPMCIVAHTIKGKGVSFMEGQVLWHYRDPQGELFQQAIRELEAARP